MNMTTRTSKLVLTSHITSSVGWLGAVAVFIALATTALTSQDIPLAKACFLAMEISTWIVIVPFCLISLATGIIQASFTKWGLFNHYWIVVKLFLTVASTILLFLHLQPISYLAEVAKGTSLSQTDYANQLISIISRAGAAILVLVFITTISVYKPWGKIFIKKNTETKNNTWSFYLYVGLAILLMIIILFHLLSGKTMH